MGITIYSQTGCIRCKVVKDFMNNNGIAYDEHNLKAGGKKAFQKFYRENRPDIFRGPHGIVFPMLTDGETIYQGIGACIGFLQAGKKLKGFLTAGVLHQHRVDGIHISEGDPKYGDNLLGVLRYIKHELHMKTFMDTDGRNSTILEKILREKLGDNVVMKVLGSKKTYEQILGPDIDMNDVKKTINLVSEFPENCFKTIVIPITDGDKNVRYLDVNEVAGAAHLLEEVTNSKTVPYHIEAFDLEDPANRRFNSLQHMDFMSLLPYRNVARRYQFLTTIKAGATIKAG
ncbi:MAG: hypothetical protein WC124_13510 [Desulfoplanes sp.]